MKLDATKSWSERSDGMKNVALWGSKLDAAGSGIVLTEIHLLSRYIG
jgi:hypothetical protein